MKVKIEFVYPPIPVRNFDYSAVDDDTYEPGCPIGFGETPELAEANLREILSEIEGGSR